MKINLTKEPISKTTVYEASHKNYEIAIVHEQIENESTISASFQHDDDDEYAKENYTQIVETSTNLLKEYLAGEEFDRGELVNVELYWEAPDIGEEPKTSIIAVFKQLHFKGVKNMIQGYSMKDGHFYMDYSYYEDLKRSGEYPLHKDKQILSTLEDTYGYKLNVENKPL